MNIWKISLKNIRSKPLYTVLSVLMLSLSIALLLGIQQIKVSFEHQMENNLGDIDVVVGAKGSPLQLVLSSVLHLDNPTGNIPYSTMKTLKRNPLIKKAVPLSYGDNYKGYRIVGSSPEFLQIYQAEIEKGKRVAHPFEVVLGHTVAQRLQLKIGDRFKSAHGLIENEIDIHDHDFVVVGILKPTQKVIDRLIISTLESIWGVHDHEHDNENSETEKEITSLLISFRSPTAVLTFPRGINKNTNMQAALPKYELERLYQFTGVGLDTIAWIAYIILVISGVSIFISLYKMVKERAFDLALLRTYGASHLELIKMVSYEGLVVVGAALVVGLTLSKVSITSLRLFMENVQQDIIVALPIIDYLEIIGIVFVIIVLSIIFAIYPIIKMNISTILSNEK